MFIYPELRNDGEIGWETTHSPPALVMGSLIATLIHHITHNISGSTITHSPITTWDWIF